MFLKVPFTNFNLLLKIQKEALTVFIDLPLL